jgi:ADP-L-glycero-D-manno-heptose 6-epimerase
MKILITGTNGFIGKNLLNELKNKHEILEINEDIFDIEDWYNEIYFKLNKFNPEVVFHVGACSDTLETDVNYMMTRNFEFTRRVAEWCQLLGKKFIYSSSAANFGTNEEYPSNLYGWSKYVAEQYVVKCGGIGLRYFNVYGPLEDQKGKMASVAYQMLKKQKEGQEIKLFPNKPQRDFVYVKDVVSANLYAMENFEKNMGEWYEVGSGEDRTFEDVLDILKIDYTYHNEIDIPKGYQFHTKSNSENWMSGWTPQYNLEKGLEDYLTFLVK